MKQRRHERQCQHGEGDGARHGKQEREAQTPVEQLAIFGVPGVGMILRQARQENGTQRDAEHARREFHQPVGVVEPGHAAGDEEGGEDRVDEQRYLADRDAECRRRHQLEHAPHAGMRPIEPRARKQSKSCESGNLEYQLQGSADEHRPSENQDRRIKVVSKEQSADDERDVEHGRRNGRERKTVPGVQDAGGKRYKRNERDVRKGDAQHRDRQTELDAVGRESRG